MSLVSKAKDKAEKAKLDLAVYEYTGDLPDERYTSAEYELAKVDDQTIREFFDDEPIWQERFFEYLDEGYVGTILHNGDEWMSRGWTITPESDSAPRALPDSICSEECYWLFGTRTNQDYRGMGLFKEINRVRIKNILERDPDAQIYTDTGVDNVARYGIESSGFEPHGTITLLRFELPGSPLWKWGRWNREADHPALPE